MFANTSASAVYRPRGVDSEMYGDEELEKLRKSRFQADKGFSGAEQSGPRDGMCISRLCIHWTQCFALHGLCCVVRYIYMMCLFGHGFFWSIFCFVCIYVRLCAFTYAS